MWNPLNFLSNRKSKGQSDHTDNVTAMDSEAPEIENSGDISPVSYTHLTLPTICSV